MSRLPSPFNHFSIFFTFPESVIARSVFKGPGACISIYQPHFNIFQLSRKLKKGDCPLCSRTRCTYQYLSGWSIQQQRQKEEQPPSLMWTFWIGDYSKFFFGNDIHFSVVCSTPLDTSMTKKYEYLLILKTLLLSLCK